MRKFAIAAALLALVPAAAAHAQRQEHPVDPKSPDGWRMQDLLPPMTQTPCAARITGPDVNTNLALNKDRQPVLLLGRPDWHDLKGQAIAKLSIDNAPPIDLPVFMVINITGAVVTDPALTEKLKHAKTVTWTLPMGRFEARNEGFEAALAAVTACTDQRDGPKTP